MRGQQRSPNPRIVSVTVKVVLSALLIFAASPTAKAATLCVNPTGKGGCFTTIGAAVIAAAINDTIQVAKGTYDEDVIIGKSLSLIGANQKNTIIDATGQANGVYIDGIDNPGLSSVVASGFTVRDANFEGILVANASSVTVSGNIVSDNDKALVPATPACPGIPAFETAEGFDCGEAIHLMGADHSIVANNLVENNAGGILISDDTARADHNLISGNTVSKNQFDCGITLASHPPATLTGSATPLGVTHNTISGNLSTSNGLSVPGAGAGVGIFDSIPGTTASGNLVINNTLTNNGLPGVAMHSHTPGQDLTDNVIVSNTISGNGADTDDAATSGPTGINVFGVSAASGTIISGNNIKGESLDVVVNTPTNTSVNLNNLLGKGVGVQNLSTGTVDATQNWWGCANGPGAKGCTTVGGSGPVLSIPFANKKF
jgi:parallel beta-helix repeat protein